MLMSRSNVRVARKLRIDLNFSYQLKKKLYKDFGCRNLIGIGRQV